ncbi:MAG: leucyl aminopeptidase [Frankiales bacterium]|nr:leucyl aminopeptidase [Frankiales bacterium]
MRRTALVALLLTVACGTTVPIAQQSQSVTGDGGSSAPATGTDGSVPGAGGATGSPQGGTAGTRGEPAFLGRFAPDGTPYPHLDIAGPADNPGKPYGSGPHGRTGYGVATLVELLD